MLDCVRCMVNAYYLRLIFFFSWYTHSTHHKFLLLLLPLRACLQRNVTINNRALSLHPHPHPHPHVLWTFYQRKGNKIKKISYVAQTQITKEKCQFSHLAQWVWAAFFSSSVVVIVGVSYCMLHIPIQMNWNKF